MTDFRCSKVAFRHPSFFEGVFRLLRRDTRFRIVLCFAHVLQLIVSSFYALGPIPETSRQPSDRTVHPNIRINRYPRIVVRFHSGEQKSSSTPRSR